MPVRAAPPMSRASACSGTSPTSRARAASRYASRPRAYRCCPERERRGAPAHGPAARIATPSIWRRSSIGEAPTRRCARCSSIRRRRAGSSSRSRRLPSPASSRPCLVPSRSARCANPERVRSRCAESRRPEAGGVDRPTATPLLPTRLLVGVDGAWWLPQSSKLVRPDFVWLGGFDSHTLPPGRPVLDSHVSRSDIHVVLLRVARALRLVACVALIAATLPDDLSAQERDSARVGAVPAPGPRRAAPVDTVPEPPISPGRAFFSSLLVPGLGQSELDRPIAGMIFVAVEAVSIVMIQKSQKELAYAKRVGKIGVPCPGDDTGLLCLDPGPPSGNPPTYPEA